MAKTWIERRPAYHVYTDPDLTTDYGDVRAASIDPVSPCVYDAVVYTPAPDGMILGRFATFEEAKTAVQDEVIRQSL